MSAAAYADPGQVSLLDAVKSALSNHPLLRAQQAQIDVTRGTKEIVSGAFNPLLQSGVSQNLTNSEASLPGAGGQLAPSGLTETVNQTMYSASATKLYRDGMTVTPSFQVTRTTDSLQFPEGLSTSQVGITVNIPLLRGRGSKVVAARETAAQAEVQAAQLDLDFLISQLAATAASDYWSFVSAAKNLAVALSAEERGNTYVSNTQALIDGGHVPRNDINEVAANLALRVSNRVVAQTNLVLARQQLAFDMGIPAEQILDRLGDPSDDFPAIPAQVSPSNSEQSQQRYLSTALTQRADYTAAQNRKGQQVTLLPPAENALLPGLNLSVGGGYQGLRAGRAPGDFLISPFFGVKGPNVSAGLTYTFPVGNQAAKGALLQARAAIRQADVQVEQAARGISQSVTVALESVRNAILRVQKTRQEVELWQASLEGAREKYRLGIGSVVEILQVEDQLNSALGAQVQAQTDYAVALTQFRFATGTLVAPNQPVPTVGREVFMNLPFADAEGNPR